MTQQNIAIITPPFTGLNTPYPASAYLTRFLSKKGYQVHQKDISLETFLTLFSRSELERVFLQLEKKQRLSERLKLFIAEKKRYLSTINYVIRFLQGADPTLGYRIAGRNFLPEGYRFKDRAIDSLQSAFDISDKAKFIATLYIEEIADIIREYIDPDFDLIRYSERLGLSQHSFDQIEIKLQSPHTMIEEIYIRILESWIKNTSPSHICFTVPFPGNLFSTLRMAQYIKKSYPHIVTIAGGGFITTELGTISDSRFFKYIDFLVYNNGEKALEAILNHTLFSKQGTEYSSIENISFLNKDTVIITPRPDLETKTCTPLWPDYKGLDLTKYISLFDNSNMMMRLWSDGRWNKLTLAYGCYWKKCSFCDTSLEYIKDFSPLSAEEACDRIETLISETGDSGFHFVDEAAPPALLKKIAVLLLQRGISCSYWTNIRFEKSFSPDLCRLLALSGCIAVSGGVEVASKRILKLINKGVSLKELIGSSYSFGAAGILVHAYLMYGFPTQTEQETVESLEIVRQLFQNGCIDSGYWHRFTLTCHSAVYSNPEKFSIMIMEPESSFARNDILHKESNNKTDHSLYSSALNNALFNYMQHDNLTDPVESWFEQKKIRSTIDKHLVQNTIQEYYSDYQNDLSSKREVFVARNVDCSAKHFTLTVTAEGNEYKINSNRQIKNFIIELQKQYSLYSIIPFNKFVRILENNKLEFSDFFLSESGQFLRELALFLL